MLSNLLNLAGTREDAILLLSTKEGQDKTKCTMAINIPNHVTVRDCSWRQPSLIDSCNITGSWQYYDEVIDRACALYESVIFSKYRNIFCFLCNTDQIFVSIFQLKRLLQDGGVHQVPSFTYAALFTFDDYPALPSTVSRQAPRCPHNAIYFSATASQLLQCVLQLSQRSPTVGVRAMLLHMSARARVCLV